MESFVTIDQFNHNALVDAEACTRIAIDIL
jgi:hypothetical protein